MLQIDREIFDSRPAHRGLGASLLLHARRGRTALLAITLPAALLNIPIELRPFIYQRRPSSGPLRPSVDRAAEADSCAPRASACP